jgi:hypothetical protein
MASLGFFMCAAEFEASGWLESYKKVKSEKRKKE